MEHLLFRGSAYQVLYPGMVLWKCCSTTGFCSCDYQVPITSLKIHYQRDFKVVIWNSFFFPFCSIIFSLISHTNHRSQSSGILFKLLFWKYKGSKSDWKSIRTYNFPLFLSLSRMHNFPMVFKDNLIKLTVKSQCYPRNYALL